MSFMESQNQDVKFMRVDADITEILKSEKADEEDNKSSLKSLKNCLKKLQTMIN